MTLSPVGQLPPQDWMQAPATRAVIAALTANGASVRFVGGCVRDSVLKRKVKDIDIATHDPPETVLALLEGARIRAIPTGIAHGTVTAVIGQDHFEITTLRTDIETDGRHARVAFTDDWTADAARRDFTINALFCDPDGNIFDPFDGLSDLGAGRIRFVGDPRKRIEEDVLRLLRFFRFYAHYGAPPPDQAALAACRAKAQELKRLSAERICGELFKLLSAPDPASVMLLMAGEKVLEAILPEAHAFGRLRILSWLEQRGIVRDTVHPDPLRRLAAVLETDASGAEAVANRLKLSAAEKKRLVTLTKPKCEKITHATDAKAARRALYALGADIFRDVALIAWADRKSQEPHTPHAETEAWEHLLDAADAWTPRELPIKGRDLEAMGIPAGPRMGEILKVCETHWIASDFQASASALLELVRKAAEK